jgi:hypothetical protein
MITRGRTQQPFSRPPQGLWPGLEAPETPFRLAPAGDTADPLCRRCQAVGTHYLTCPSLRLPEGYRHRLD